MRPQADLATNEEAESASPEESRLRRVIPGMKFLFRRSLAVQGAMASRGEQSETINQLAD